MATMEAMLAPKPFQGKDLDPEDLLIEFDKYVKMIKTFFIATGRVGATSEVKLAILLAVGGVDMEDLFETVGKVNITAVAAVVADRAQGIEAVEAVAADSFEEGVTKIRKAIVARTNQAMSRLRLLQQMPQGDSKFEVWSKEIMKQARRCDWSEYDESSAARDAILFQTSDQKLRKKILAENMTYEQTVVWGRTHESSSKKARQVESATNTDQKVRRLEEQVNRLQVQEKQEQVPCKTCPRKSHRVGAKCPGLTQSCYACGQEGHFKGAQVCKGPKHKADRKSKDDKKDKAVKKDRGTHKKVNRVDSSEDESDSDESEAESIHRIVTVRATQGPDSGEKDLKVKVTVKPRRGGDKQEVVWTADTGVLRTLLAERDWDKLKKKNENMQLKKAKTVFRPYGTQYSLPVLGKAKVKLQCVAGAKSKSMVYVVKGQKESLLGRVDSEKLGIVTIKRKGEPGTKDTVRQLAEVKLQMQTQRNQSQLQRKMAGLLDQYPQLFTGIGQARVPPVHIHIKEGVSPVTQKLRPVPVSMMDPLKAKLDMYVKEGVIEGPLGADQATGWVHNVVLTGKKWDPKAIRLNLDTRMMKKAVVPAQYPIPTPEQLRHKFLGSNRYSIVDLNDAFHQFPLDEESKELFKFTTPYGIYKYHRLVMGAHPASGECQSKMAEILRGLEGVVQIKDDIVVHGKDDQHDERLEAVLDRLREFNITLRRDKCSLGQSAVKWFGHIFSEQGMSPDPEKVENIRAWPEPKDKAEVKSFLQTVQFCAPYMRMGEGETYSDVTGPLRKLTRHGTHFKWTEECSRSFKKLKSQLSSDTVLMNYDPSRKTRVYVDHGPDGLASTVAQGYSDVKDPRDRNMQWRPVYHTSRALTKAERAYGKMDGESLGVYSGIITNRRYLYGTEFTVVTDHQPLVPLYNNPSRPAPVRVERHRSKLRHFTFDLQYEPGYTSPCDYASRHPPAKTHFSEEEKREFGVEDEEEDKEIWVNRVEEQAEVEAVTLAEVRQALQEDYRLKQLMKEVTKGRMDQDTKSSEYGQVFTELTVANGLLLKGEQLVIPRSLYGRVLAAAHEGHQGEDRTIRNLRERNWFPGMAEKCRMFVKSCHPGCTASVPGMRPAPMLNRDTPDGPWKVLSADYKGPIGGPRGYYFHVLVDQYSKWPEVCVTDSTRFQKLFPVLDRTFATHGIPEEIVHDGGPPYNSKEWRRYAKETGFEIRPCTPEHPQSNGLAEKMMTSIVKVTHAALAEKKNPKEEISKFLINYRNTPHSSTKKKPSELMMNRTVRTKLPVLIKPPRGELHLTAQANDRAAKAKHKEYGDKHRRARHTEVAVGDRVLIKQSKTTTRPPWDPAPYVVTGVRGTQVTAKRGSKQRIRNIEKWKVLKERPEEITVKRKETSTIEEEESDTDFDIMEEEQDRHLPVEGRVEEQRQGVQQDQEEGDRGAARLRRSARQVRAPDRLGEDRNQEQLSPRHRKRKQAMAKYRPRTRTTPIIRKERWVVREGWLPKEQEEGDPEPGEGDQN